jgi:thioredoxin reductase (NADPH)
VDDERCRETPDVDDAHPRLSREHIATLEPLGERRRVQAGEVLYRAGDRERPFYVVLDGLVAGVDRFGDQDERTVFVHGPGRFLGELGLLTGEPAFLTNVVCAAGEVLAVPIERVRRVCTDDTGLGDLLLRSFLRRRSLLVGMGAGLKLVGSRFSPGTRRLRDFLARNRVPHAWIDVEDDASAEALLRELGIEPGDTPVVVLGDDVLRHPSNEELAERLGLRGASATPPAVDLLVVGAGPAGLAAAVYGASEGLHTVVVEAESPGGQAGTSPRIENYLGFPSGISGDDLAERARIQAEKFGARLMVPASAAGLHSAAGVHHVRLDDGSEVATRCLLVATGARYRRLNVPRLREFEGLSVFYAATQIEAAACVAQPVAVVGGGNSAAQAALFLSRIATRVHLIVLHDDLTRDMSRYLADRIERTPAIEVLLNTEVRELLGDAQLEGIVVEDRAGGRRHTIGATRLFIFIGAEPHTDWLRGEVELDERGFVLTGRRAADHGRAPSHLETSRPGVLAAGDVRAGSVRRMSAAVGEGATAIRLVHALLVAADDEQARAGVARA